MNPKPSINGAGLDQKWPKILYSQVFFDTYAAVADMSMKSGLLRGLQQL